MDSKLSIRDYINKFNKGDFSDNDVDTQIDAGWYDWFCKDSSLRNKTYKLTAKLKQIIGSTKINIDTSYVFFKNNCPCAGHLYDDFRICDLKSGDVIYTIVPKSGHTGGVAELWGKKNDFKEPLIEGTWNDIKKYFLS